MRFPAAFLAVLLFASAAWAQPAPYSQLRSPDGVSGEAFDGTGTRAGAALGQPYAFTDDLPPSQPERDRHEKERKKDGLWGGLIGGAAGVGLFGGLALAGVLPWSVMLAGVPAFIVLGISAGLDFAGE